MSAKPVVTWRRDEARCAFLSSDGRAVTDRSIMAAPNALAAEMALGVLRSEAAKA